MNFGIQMFGANKRFLENPSAFFEKLSDMGYRYIEPCILFSDETWAKDFMWSQSDLSVYYPLAQKYGLTIYSCHIFTADIEKVLPDLQRLAAVYGIRQFVFPCPEEVTRENYSKYAEHLLLAADTLADISENNAAGAPVTGAQILLHNMSLECSTQLEGMSAYEWLLKRCGGKIGAQPDLGWLLHGGLDPESFLWHNKEYVWSLHYKDMKQTAEGLKETAVGTGVLDMTAAFQFARAMEIPQLIDQDGSAGDILEDLRSAKEKLNILTSVRDRTSSSLCVLDTQTGEIKELRSFERIIEAPNWLNNGDDLLYNSEGRMYRYSISKDTEERLDTDFCVNCNNDHVLSPDHTMLAVSHSTPGTWESKIYTLPLAGGGAREVTRLTPSFLHGWSPDGKELAFCGMRMIDGQLCTDIYTIPADSITGLDECRMTHGEGYNDGCEYSPDGKYIWFTSTRTGLMQIWRMERDGKNQTQMTFNERNNWFPHISPDNRQVIYISYSKKGLDAGEHLPNMNVELWMMDIDGGNQRKIAGIFGGQGTINVNSWAPDRRHVAFVSYMLEHR